MKQFRRQIAFVIFFSFVFSLYTSFISALGFETGTLVHTPTGKKPIETLAINDEVWAFDLKTNSYVAKPIAALSSKTVNSVVELSVDGATIVTDDDQQFYTNNNWQTAQNSSLLFISPLESLPRASLKKSFRKTTIHDIGVADLHNYFVSPRPILAHNFLIEAGVVIVFGAGGFEILWTGALTLFGIGVAAAYSVSKNEIRKTEVNCTEALSNAAYAAFGPEHAKKAYLESENQNSQESQNSQKNSSGAVELLILKILIKKNEKRIL